MVLVPGPAEQSTFWNNRDRLKLARHKVETLETFRDFLKKLFFRTSLTIQDILPANPKHYDKMRPPRKDGAPTTVFFHVTVMGLDSIDENAMVSFISLQIHEILSRLIFIVSDVKEKNKVLSYPEDNFFFEEPNRVSGRGPKSTKN